jgi:hypothetical protein
MPTPALRYVHFSSTSVYRPAQSNIQHNGTFHAEK